MPNTESAQFEYGDFSSESPAKNKSTLPRTKVTNITDPLLFKFTEKKISFFFESLEFKVEPQQSHPPRHDRGKRNQRIR